MRVSQSGLRGLEERLRNGKPQQHRARCVAGAMERLQGAARGREMRLEGCSPDAEGLKHPVKGDLLRLRRRR